MLLTIPFPLIIKQIIIKQRYENQDYYHRHTLRRLCRTPIQTVRTRRDARQREGKAMEVDGERPLGLCPRLVLLLPAQRLLRRRNVLEMGRLQVRFPRPLQGGGFQCEAYHAGARHRRGDAAAEGRKGGTGARAHRGTLQGGTPARGGPVCRPYVCLLPGRVRPYAGLHL